MKLTTANVVRTQADVKTLVTIGTWKNSSLMCWAIRFR